ncbi:MAG TPA: hypothetical protein VMX38_05640 [Verrucomicrobiae bacterium]|nr:hypothetical protein [Verrucomicrobiae bacterium]
MALRLWLQWFTLAIISAPVCLAQVTANTQEPLPKAGCTDGPYCARTDRKIEPYPETPPAIGPAGSIISDPTFGSRILRVTDPGSDPKGLGRSLFTPSSAEQNTWNKNSTMFYVTTSGGSFQLYNFDPVNMKAHAVKTPNVGWGAEPQFSYRKTNILYGVDRREGAVEQYDTETGKISDVFRVSKCVKLRPRDWTELITASADDNRFMTVVGPGQDNNYLVLVYDRTQGCRWYNPTTGEIGGDWGPKGIITPPDRFPIHNARMAKSGKFLYVTRGGGGSPGHRWVVWEIDTLKVTVCSMGCSGHHVLGYTHILGSSGLVHPMDVVSRPLDHLADYTSIISGLSPSKGEWYDSHFSWNNVDPDDSEPLCFSTYQMNNPNTPGTPLLVIGPWENEIDCAATKGASKVWRFAHTYSTARNGFWSTPRGNVSQDGRFYMFTSDWEDELGRGPDNKYRSDVFIVELK